MNSSDFENAWLNKDKSNKKLSRSSFLKRFLIDIKDLFLLIKDCINGRYRQLPFWMIAAIACALIYIINPLDLLPDVIPILGLIDDVLVLFLCISLLRMDLNKYRRWKNRKRTSR